MSGRSSQRKGRSGEKEIVSILHDAGYDDARPGAPVSYGTEPDVVCQSLPIHVEVKRCERVCLPEWFRQSERDSERFGDGVPSVCFRRSREAWMIVLKLSDFLTLIRPQKTDTQKKES